jgi:hypothetical protein
MKPTKSQKRKELEEDSKLMKFYEAKVRKALKSKKNK